MRRPEPGRYTYTVSTARRRVALAKRKVFRSGNSVVVSLPEEALECLQVGVGGEVSLDLDWKRRELVVRPVPALPQGVSEEFARQVAEFIAEYRPALEALARE